MQPNKLCLVCSLAGLLLLPVTARPDDWTTLGYDAQRSSWVRADNKTSPTTVRAPDFRFLWKIDLPNEPRSGNSLTPPALLDFLISHRGFRSLAFVGGEFRWRLRYGHGPRTHGMGEALLTGPQQELHRLPRRHDSQPDKAYIGADAVHAGIRRSWQAVTGG